MLRPWKLKLNIVLDKKNGSLYKQLATELLKQIELGVLRVGEALPGSRELARQLGVSRKTVVAAMNQLVEDGWLENRDRVGIFVCDKRDPASLSQPQNLTTSQPNNLITSKPNNLITSKPQNLTPSPPHPLGVAQLVVTDGFPDTLLLPLDDMGRIYRQVVNRAARWKMMGYYDARGNPILRKQLAEAITHEQGISVTGEQIILTRGAQQAFYLIAHALLKPGDKVVVESLAYANVCNAIESAGVEILTVPVDGEGMRTEVLEKLLPQHPEIRAVIITPRFHYPTTATMSNARRHHLAALSETYGFTVVNNDFDSHFDFTNQKYFQLSSMIPMERYIYINTLSKVIAPVIRMASVYSSPENINRLMTYRCMVDTQGDALMEHTMQVLMDSGALKRHLNKVRRVYRERLDYAHQQIKQHLHGMVKYKRPNGGLALWLVINRDPRPRLQYHGIEAPIFELPDNLYGIRVGYAAMTHENIDFLISALKEV